MKRIEGNGAPRLWERLRDRRRFARTLREAAREPVAAARSRAHDVVVVPCWRRPEFLWHCLDNLSRAEGIEDVHIVICPDTGAAPENQEVVRAFRSRLPSYEIREAVTSPFRRTKQSSNVLLAYLYAAALSRHFVFLVEEDIIVARDFLTWNRAVHAAAGPLFCSIGVKNHNREVALEEEPEGYYLSSGDFCSHGVCFDRQVLRERIAPHVRLDYMRRPKAYLRRHFPDSSVGLGFVEQDGLIRRIQERSRLPIAYPCLPRAFDAGFYGYNRPGGIPGPEHSRRARLGDIIYDRERLRAVAAPEFADQCVPIDLEPPVWRVQRRVELGSVVAAAAPLPDRAA